MTSVACSCPVVSSSAIIYPVLPVAGPRHSRPFPRAFYIQPAASLICLGLLVLALIALYIALSGVRPTFVRRLYRELKLKHILGSFVVIVLAGWAVTFVRAIMRLQSW